MDAMSYRARKELFSRVYERRRLSAARKFMVWVAVGTITMLFAAFTSAYIVRMAEGNWQAIRLPLEFAVSSVVILISSLALWRGSRYVRRDEVPRSRPWFVAAWLLGAVFLVLQWMGFADMVERGIYMVGEVAGSYVYVLAGMHALHVLLGLAFVGYTTYAAFAYRIDAKRDVPLYVTNVLWHFLAGLWIYLYFFMLLTQKTG